MIKCGGEGAVIQPFVPFVRLKESLETTKEARKRFERRVRMPGEFVRMPRQ